MLLPFLRLLDISGACLSIAGATGQREVIAASDEIAERIEELQFELGEGPGFDAMATGMAHQFEPSVGSSGGAPFFDAAVREVAAATIITLPLRVGAMVVGVVTLYREQPGLLTPADMATAAALAHWVAGPAVERALQAAGDESHTPGSRTGTLRREVHQATGMIVVQLDTTAGEAFARLKAYAFAHGRSVHAVAHDVVTRRLSFADPTIEE